MPSSLMLSLVLTDQDQCNPGRCSDGFRHSATKPHVPPSIIQGRQAYKRGLPKCQLGQTLFGQSARRQTEVVSFVGRLRDFDRRWGGKNFLRLYFFPKWFEIQNFYDFWFRWVFSTTTTKFPSNRKLTIEGNCLDLASNVLLNCLALTVYDSLLSKFHLFRLKKFFFIWFALNGVSHLVKIFWMVILDCGRVTEFQSWDV